MSVGAPLLCIASEESELSGLVHQHKIGKCFTPDQVQEMVAYIESLADNHDYHQMISRNSLFASKQYGPENAERFTGI